MQPVVFFASTIADAMACESKVLPSPFAPYSMTLKIQDLVVIFWMVTG